MIESTVIRCAVIDSQIGRLVGRLPERFTGAGIDSRTIQPGELFVAFPGEQTHGARFVTQAVANGATAAVVEEQALGLVEIECPLVVVANPERALQEVARAHRRTLVPRVVAVTGSVGKTTTKELTAAVLAAGGDVLSNKQNLNNELGLPLTLLRLGPHHRYAVLEMGMDGLGQIRRLAELAEPEIGVITNVGPVHLERLGTIENIQAAKAELVEALPATGVAVLNADDPRVAAMAARTAATVVSFGTSAAADVRLTAVQSLGLGGIRFDVSTAHGTRTCRLHCLGTHNALNAAAAIAVGLVTGISLDTVIEALAQYAEPLRLVPLPGKRGVTVIDDTYNASPASVLAALDALAGLPGRRVAVLGDMKELGSFETEGHRLVGARAAQVVQSLVTVGRLGGIIADAAREAGLDEVHAVADNSAALDALATQLAPGDTVLVKGSHSMHLEAIVTALRA